ncbi:hypothetical protein [uncultured Aquimarina sp.]|uniref:hypothetical protein n=1 Tax=uncultured Aquimarina sp. TaxID=575652 RepID=UPI00262DEB99|nr:hypothetical protein [uncultured Aquimarina sp.]
MTNLETYGVQELSVLETTQIDGGDGIFTDILDALERIDAGWDRFKERLADGWDSYGECSCGGE